MEGWAGTEQGMEWKGMARDLNHYKNQLLGWDPAQNKCLQHQTTTTTNTTNKQTIDL
jgi:hypothetical protein